MVAQYADTERLQHQRLVRLYQELGGLFAKDGDFGTLFQACTGVVRQQLRGTIVAIWSYNNRGKYLDLLGVSVSGRLPQQEDGSGETYNWKRQDGLVQTVHFPVDQSLIGQIVLERRSLLGCAVDLDDLGLELICPSDESSFNVLEEKPKQLFFYGYPLIQGANLLGVLGLWHCHLLSESSQDALIGLVQYLAIAMDQRISRRALQSHRESLLFRLANQIRNSLDLDTILDSAVQEIRNLLNVDHCYYLWCWKQHQVVSIMVSHEANGNKKNIGLLNNYDIGKVRLITDSIVNLQPLRIFDLELDLLPLEGQLEEQSEFINWLKEVGFTAMLMTPLKTRSDHLGAILCSSETETRYWSNDDLDLLQGVVDQLAIAIDQAELFAQARATALAAQTQAQQLQLTIEELKQTQSQLIQTEKMSSLGQMVAGIAHEINNPVNFITGNLTYTKEYVENLLQLMKVYQTSFPDIPEEIVELQDEIDLDFLMEDLPKILTSMYVGAERIREIVLSLRNFSRLDQADMKPADIHEGLDNTLMILQSRLKAMGERPEIKLVKNYTTLPNIVCYPGQLNQVLMNLISNSIDAVENNTADPCIKISTEWIHADEKSIENAITIKIEDNGSGMDQETISHIFDPFFTTKPVGKGTGLGLSISYQIIVEKHHGTIQCFSKPGEGTEFLITLPFVNDDYNENKEL